MSRKPRVTAHLYLKTLSPCTVHISWRKIIRLASLKVDVPIFTFIFFTFNWLTLTSEMPFVKFHPEVASCLLSRGKRMYVPLGMRLLWKYIRNYFLVYQLFSHILLYLPNYKEYEAEILDLQLEKYGLSFDIKKWTTSGWALGDENVISIRSFNIKICSAGFKSRPSKMIIERIVSPWPMRNTEWRCSKSCSVATIESNFSCIFHRSVTPPITGNWHVLTVRIGT